MDPGSAPLLPSIPFDEPSRRRAAHVLGDVKAGADFIAHNLPRYHAALVRLNPYPRPWRAVAVTAVDGARLAAWHAAGRPGGPAVVMVPGTFQTKDDTSRKRRAIDLWRRLGAHVLIFDQRGFGGSHSHLGTGGALESRDALEAADWLRAEAGVAKVHLWGESLGGAVALNAATRPGAQERLAGVLAWSPFADLSDAILASSPKSRRGRTVVGRTYRWLLRRRARGHDGLGDIGDFGDYLRARARDLGVDVRELIVAGSPCYHLEDLKVPAHVFHAVDDPVVPVNHARLLERVARDRQPLLRVTIQPRGAHLDFDRIAPRWYAATTAALLGGA